MSTLDEKRFAAEGFGKLAFRNRGDDDKGHTNAPIERAEMKLRVSADGEQNEYSYVSADFGAHISGDMQWTGKVEEATQEDMQFGTVLTDYGFSILLSASVRVSFIYPEDSKTANEARDLVHVQQPQSTRQACLLRDKFDPASLPSTLLPVLYPHNVEKAEEETNRFFLLGQAQVVVASAMSRQVCAQRSSRERV